MPLVEDNSLTNRRNTKDEPQEKNVCTICEQEFSDTHNCSVCYLLIHILYRKADEGNRQDEQSITWNRSLRSEKINNIRDETKIELEN